MRSPLRRFVVIGQLANASGDFLLDDLPGTSGRLDILLRCVRAAMLFSHGIRHNAAVYLVLGGGPHAPRVLRMDGATARFVRPDERSLALLAKKMLSSRVDATTSGFVEVRPGIAVSRGGLDDVLIDVGTCTPYLLEEGAPDIRGITDLAPSDAAFFLGDHLGLDDATRTKLAAVGARPIGVGPVSIHAEDAITIVTNELDRRSTRRDS
ncbi:MAG: tRNA (pseudouridine(54)-N(1))-methyltransferase TrmY [Polyangiaceae bacterium]